MKKKALSWLIICALVLSLGTVCALAQEEEEQAPALSDDLYSFQLMLDGELYTFPMSYEDFTAMGWEYQGDENEQLSPNQYTVAETFAKDGLEIPISSRRRRTPSSRFPGASSTACPPRRISRRPTVRPRIPTRGTCTQS